MIITPGNSGSNFILICDLCMSVPKSCMSARPVMRPELPANAIAARLGQAGLRLWQPLAGVNCFCAMASVLDVFRADLFPIPYNWLMHQGDKRGRHSSGHNLLPDMHLCVPVLRVTKGSLH